MIKNARSFIGDGSGGGDKICCCCGCGRAVKLTSKVLKPTFNDITVFMQFASEYICEACEKLYNDSNMRFKPIYSDAEGGYRIPGREEILEILSEPPNMFVMSLPYSFKKHHWLHAGISTNKVAKIGTDDRMVMIDYRKNDISRIINTIKRMIAGGVPRGEIISGKYSIFTLDKFPLLERDEKTIEPLRQCGAVELFVKYTPAIKEKKKYESERDNVMLSTSEINAVNLLSSIAKNSEYRMQNGIGFWGGFYERRINRFKNNDIKIFVEKLTAAVSAKDGIWCNMLKDLTEDELDEIMSEIRNKTHILVAIVYGERNKD